MYLCKLALQSCSVLQYAVVCCKCFSNVILIAFYGHLLWFIMMHVFVNATFA